MLSSNKKKDKPLFSPVWFFFWWCVHKIILPGALLNSQFDLFDFSSFSFYFYFFTFFPADKELHQVSLINARVGGWLRWREVKLRWNEAKIEKKLLKRNMWDVTTELVLIFFIHFHIIISFFSLSNKISIGTCTYFLKIFQRKKTWIKMKAKDQRWWWSCWNRQTKNFFLMMNEFFFLVYSSKR